MKAYTEGSDNPEAALDSTEKILPNIEVGKILELENLESEQNFTKPPARYTEASLVKNLKVKESEDHQLMLQQFQLFKQGNM